MREEDLSYFEEDEFKASLARYEDMLNGGPSAYLDADELTDIAEYYMVNNREAEAHECIEYALKLHPGDVDPLIFKARQEMFKGNLNEARILRNRIIDQTDREVYFLNAELMIREQQAEEASDYLWQLAETTQEEQALFIYDSACIFLDYAYYDIAQKWWTWMQRLSPGFKASLLGAEIFNASECYKEAIPLLDDALDKDPYSTKAWNMMAEAQCMEGNFYEAIEAADFALAIDEHNALALLLKANSRFHQKHYEEAHALYQQYQEKHPSNELPYLFDGICLNRMDRTEEAAKQLQKAEKEAQGISPEQTRIYLEQAFVQSKLHHPDKAIAYLEKACEEDGEDLEYNLLKGCILLENDMEEKAQDAFHTAIEESRHPEQTKYAIAAAFCENEQYEKAISLFLEVMNGDDTELAPQCFSYLAYCYLRTDDYDNYLHFLKRAGSEDRENAQVIFGPYYPGVDPEEYYLYAYKQVNGRFPKDTDSAS